MKSCALLIIVVGIYASACRESSTTGGSAAASDAGIDRGFLTGGEAAKIAPDLIQHAQEAITAGLSPGYETCARAWLARTGTVLSEPRYFDVLIEVEADGSRARIKAMTRAPDAWPFDDEMEACLAKLFARIEFASQENRTLRVSYPLCLRVGEGEDAGPDGEALADGSLGADVHIRQAPPPSPAADVGATAGHAPVPVPPLAKVDCPALAADGDRTKAFADVFADEPRDADWARKIEASSSASLRKAGVQAAISCRCRCCEVTAKCTTLEACAKVMEDVQEKQDVLLPWSSSLRFSSEQPASEPGETGIQFRFFACRK